MRKRVFAVLFGWGMTGLAGAVLGAAPAASPLAPYQGMFLAPSRTAIDSQGNLYVTDSRAGKVVKLGTNGTLLASRTGLSKPLGVASGNQGKVYVGEEGTRRVLVYDSTLTNSPSSLGVGTNEFLLPNHIAVDPTQSNGWIYVADSLSHQVRCYSNTTWVMTIGSKGTGTGQFDFPAGVYMSPARELYVVDQNNDRVQVFNSTGTFQRAFTLRTAADLVTTNVYGRAQGITGDGAGYVYVTDAFQDEIKVFDTQGVYQVSFGGMGEWIGQLRSPVALAMGPYSRLFVAAINNNRMEVFNIQGVTIVLVTLQVVSPYGSPIPVAGLYTNVSGTLLTNSVSSVDPRGTTQYVCTGWSMTGNAPQAGSSNVMYMVHTNNAVLNWLWKTQYNLTVSAGANGSVTASNGWWDAGSTALVSATPLQYYAFSQWTGTVSSSTTPLTLTMNQAHALAALFAAKLATNGVPQWWLAMFNLTNGGNWDAAALDDPDGDKSYTWQEWKADTVPTNPASYLGLSGIDCLTNGSLLKWHGGGMSTQYLERAVTLTGTQVQWLAIFTNVPPTAVTTNQFDSTGTNSPLFYRVRGER